jgi:succinoglycan biosynthesis protein ExoM
LGPSLKWALKCHIEPRRGISHARNTAVACTGRNADFIAFIDDDEVPKPYWLDQLLDVQRLCAADVVSGPVLPYFCDPVPEWVIRGRFFDEAFANPRYVTGHPIKLTATGNVLIRAEILREMNIPFDERLGLTGGEDIHFFRRVDRAGYKMVYAADALVYEWIPKSRTNVRWMLKRAYRLGNALSLSEAYLDPTIAVQLLRVAKGGGRLAQGLLLLLPALPMSLLLGRQASIRPLLHICRGTGMLAGLAGIRFEPYR